MFVLFKPKVSKLSHIDLKDYRPKSLLSFLLKTLERLIDPYLRSNMLSRSQHAYVKSKSVESALHDVTGFVEANLARGKNTLSAFLDIDVAFNNVTTSSIENSLREYRRIYLAIVRPVIPYGSVVCWYALDKSFQQNVLDKIQRIASFSINEIRKSCSQAVLLDTVFCLTQLDLYKTALDRSLQSSECCLF